MTGPLFKWFGSKWLSSSLSVPHYETIFEPFAGGAGYSSAIIVTSSMCIWHSVPEERKEIKMIGLHGSVSHNNPVCDSVFRMLKKKPSGMLYSQMFSRLDVGYRELDDCLNSLRALGLIACTNKRFFIPDDVR
jgi:hypothetical protein